MIEMVLVIPDEEGFHPLFLEGARPVATLNFLAVVLVLDLVCLLLMCLVFFFSHPLAWSMGW